ncbi:uncharacterized protein LOC143039237 [Oratosquilla oratoria]|uniref:uncharacterized protein LOC143039237 n=1 Tax=Oratosquilla oratoria TaxID=337810 RepID=UPI003F7725E0
MRLSLNKCEFFKSKLTFLGYEISSKGIKPPKDRATAISDFPLPQTSQALRRFMAYPSLIPTNFQLVTDISSPAVGAALYQVIDGEPTPLGFYSKKLSDTQRAYSTYDRELLAAYLAFLHFRTLINGHTVTLFLNQKPLVSAFHSKSPAKTDRQQRQLSVLSEYVSSVEYIRGDNNVVADCLSRTTCAVSLDVFDLSGIARGQETDDELETFKPRLSKFNLPPNSTLWCDTSTKTPRPFVPLPLRDDAKTAHQTSSPISPISAPTDRFQSVHIDIVGPLPPATLPNYPYPLPYKYLLTFIHRATRWTEAIPLIDTTATPVAISFVSGWICSFGVPLHVIMDRGSQFESELFSELSSIIGFHHMRTTSYHSQANGMNERFHRARQNDWCELGAFYLKFVYMKTACSKEVYLVSHFAVAINSVIDVFLGVRGSSFVD